MARSRRSRKAEPVQDNIGAFATILGALAVLAILVGAGVFLFLNTEKAIALNDDDLCPNRGARGTVAVLLDTTDELAAVTKSEIRESILSMQRECLGFIVRPFILSMKRAYRINRLLVFVIRAV